MDKGKIIAILLCIAAIALGLCYLYFVGEWYDRHKNEKTQNITLPKLLATPVIIEEISPPDPSLSCTVKPVESNLINNAYAHDPTWNEMMQFLGDDLTDLGVYNEYYHACADFAEEFHNNAEANGLKSAFVVIEFENKSVGHAMNAFSTTDYGIVFVDVTGDETNDTKNNDKVCSVEIGKKLMCAGIYGSKYEYSVVKDFEIQW
jgi:hypothetical protein